MSTKKQFDLESIPSSCSISGSDDDDFYKKPKTVTKRKNHKLTPKSNPPNTDSISETASKTSLPFSTTPISTNSNSPKSARVRPGRSNASFASSLAESPKTVADVSESPVAKPRKVRGGGLRKVLKSCVLDAEVDPKRESSVIDDSNPFGESDDTEKEPVKVPEISPSKEPVKIPKTSPRYDPKILNPKNFKPEKVPDSAVSSSKPPKKKTGFNDNSLRRTAVKNSKKVEEDSNPFGEVESEEEFDDSNPFGDEKKPEETKNPFGESEEADEFDESNPFGEPTKHDKTPKDQPTPLRNQKPAESTNPFGGDSEDELDESNPFGEPNLNITEKSEQSNNPFGDVESSGEDEYPDNKIITKKSKNQDTYDRSGRNPFGPGPDPVYLPEEESNSVKIANKLFNKLKPNTITSPKHRAAPKLPKGHKPSRPPPPSKEKLERRATMSSEGDNCSKSEDNSSLNGSVTASSSVKKRSAPNTPVAPPRPNDSDVDVELTIKQLEESKFELEQVTEEMVELEPTINEPRPSKFSVERWEELLKKQGQLVMSLNELQLKKELYDICENHRRVEYEMRVLASKSMRTMPEEQKLDNLGARLQRIMNQKMQIDEQLHPAGPEVDRGMKKKKKSMLGGLSKGLAKKLTIKK